MRPHKMMFLEGGVVSDRIESPWIKFHLESSTPRLINFTLQMCIAILAIGNVIPSELSPF